MANKQVTLFIPCLVDQTMPEAGMAALQVLEAANYQVLYNPKQVCCGQPAFNAGHWEEARHVARAFLKHFPAQGKVVSLSGSCTAMVRNFYSSLFEHDSLESTIPEVNKRFFEFSEFLLSENVLSHLSLSFPCKAAFHNSCHSRRELGLKKEPFLILDTVNGCQCVNHEEEPVCCGFGGVFSVKFPEISEHMVEQRMKHFRALGAELVVSNDPGCIMQMRSYEKSMPDSLRVLHLAEFLAEALTLGTQDTSV